jgi:hypothetical protein
MGGDTILKLASVQSAQARARENQCARLHQPTLGEREGHGARNRSAIECLENAGKVEQRQKRGHWLAKSELSSLHLDVQSSAYISLFAVF